MALVPMVVDPKGPSYDVFSRLLKDGIILLSGEINQVAADLAVSQMLYLQNAKEKKPIHLYINSGGGSVTDGMAIYDTMQMIDSPVYTYCIGKACSMASILLAGGEPNHRYCLPHSQVMIHQPLGGVQGQCTDVQIAAKNMQNIKELLAGIFAEDTGQPLKKILEDMERDKWMTPEECKKYGVVDHIYALPRKKGKK